VKVCDFGLSLLVPMGKILETQECAGTPLYVAPEALDSDHIDHSRDVYSFGISLYEFITLQEPFQEYEQLSDFLAAICQKKNPARPKIPEDSLLCPESLRKLAESCWHANPKKRPSFEEVVKEMNKNVLIDCAIFDKEARKFWKGSFENKTEVPFEEFKTAFQKTSKLKIEENSANAKCLEALFATTAEGKQVVELKTFGHILGFFPKFVPSKWLEYVASICEKPWFWGNTSQVEAEQGLQKGKGDYLVRFSSSLNNYTLSYAVEGRIYHTRILHPYGSLEFTVDGQTIKYKSLEDLLNSNMKMLGLNTPAAGGPFSVLFSGTLNYHSGQYTAHNLDWAENDDDEKDY